MDTTAFSSLLLLAHQPLHRITTAPFRSIPRGITTLGRRSYITPGATAVQIRCRCLRSKSAIDARLLYAAPSHLLCTISGEGRLRAGLPVVSLRDMC
jgi:hypothetical protein